jgi:glucose/mannose transport system permease protein
MGGGSNQQMDMPSVNMYLTTFQGNNFALGSAIAVVMLIMVAIIIIPYLVTQLRGETLL